MTSAFYLGDLDPHRLAEVLAGARGTAYRVGSGTAVTAEHVLGDSAEIGLRFDADTDAEWTVTASVAWRDPETDIAVLTFPPPGAVRAVPIGRFTDRAAVVPAETAGFPLWKLRTAASGERYRDLSYLTGSIAILADRRSGRAELVVTGPQAAPTGSPWEGMSGAPVLVGGHLIGVVIEDHLAEGPGRLTVARLDRCPPEALSAMDITGTPADVTPHPLGWTTRSAYAAQVRDIVPLGGLRDRDTELDELAAFCAGPIPYVWWRGDPWAGKSALMSSFVSRPPAGVEVVSFFVTGRLAGKADSEAFTNAMVEQLSAVIEEDEPVAVSPGSLDAHRRHLFEAAARRLGEQGRRLVLVVDGLDEDKWTPDSAMASIAALLPKNPGDHLRVIVSGRLHPPVPDDVDTDHPLRDCPIRTLSQTAYARELERAANLELNRLLAGGRLERDVLGLLAACGGGLDSAELQELTGTAPYEMDPLLGSSFGRVVVSRATDSLIGDVPRPVFLFGHEELRRRAVERLGPRELARHRDRLHTWAEGYRDDGWPTSTPAYLLLGYPRILEQDRDIPRMVAIALDVRRHQRLLEATGADGPVLTEIAAAMRAAVGQDDPDLATLMRLAYHRGLGTHRNAKLPAELPAVWAKAGRLVRAETLARSLADPVRHARAMTRLVEPYAEGGAPDTTARIVADTVTAIARIPNRWQRNRAQGDLAVAVIAAGDLRRGHEVAAGIEVPEIRREALRALALSQVARDDPGVAATIDDLARAGDRQQADAFRVVAGLAPGGAATPEARLWLLLRLGREAEARAVAGGMPEVERGLPILAEAMGLPDLADFLAARTPVSARASVWLGLAGRRRGGERCSTALEEARQRVAESTDDPLKDLVPLLLTDGTPETCRRFAMDLESSYQKDFTTLIYRSLLWRRAGDADAARAAAAAAEARVPEDEDRSPAMLAALSTVHAILGDPRRADDLRQEFRRLISGRASANPGQDLRDCTFLVGIGAHRFAETVARSIRDPSKQAQAFGAVMWEAVRSGEVDEAVTAGIALPDGHWRRHYLTELAVGLIGIGHVDRGVAVAARIEADGRETVDLSLASEVYRRTALAVLDTGRLDLTIELADGVTEQRGRDELLRRVAERQVAAGDLGAARRPALMIGQVSRRAETIAAVAEAGAAAGDTDAVRWAAAEMAVLAPDAAHAARSLLPSLLALGLYDEVTALAEAVALAPATRREGDIIADSFATVLDAVPTVDVLRLVGAATPAHRSALLGTAAARAIARGDLDAAESMLPDGDFRAFAINAMAGGRFRASEVPGRRRFLDAAAQRARASSDPLALLSLAALVRAVWPDLDDSRIGAEAVENAVAAENLDVLLDGVGIAAERGAKDLAGRLAEESLAMIRPLYGSQQGHDQLLRLAAQLSGSANEYEYRRLRHSPRLTGFADTFWQGDDLLQLISAMATELIENPAPTGHHFGVGLGHDSRHDPLAEARLIAAEARPADAARAEMLVAEVARRTERSERDAGPPPNLVLGRAKPPRSGRVDRALREGRSEEAEAEVREADALVRRAWELVERNEQARAREVFAEAAAIVDPESAVGLTEVLLQLGLFDQVAAMARRAEADDPRYQMMTRLTETLIAAGRPDQARELVEEMLGAAGGQGLAQHLVALGIQSLIETRAAQEAVAWAPLVEDDRVRDGVLGRAVTLLTADGEFAAAGTAAQGITDPSRRLAASVEVAAAACDARAPDGGRLLALAVTSAVTFDGDGKSGDYRTAVVRLVDVLMANGDRTTAGRVLASVPAGQARLRTEIILRLLGTTLDDDAQTGTLIAAYTVAARAMVGQEDYVRSMTALVTRLIEAGDQRRAADVARSIASSPVQGRELARLAVVESEHGTSPLGHALLAEALTTEGWLEAVDVAGRIAPDALRAFAEALRETLRSEA
ncbi:hypothetical protein ACTI_64380 [Actinoplanes sp. OR16]|uniref:S1 family peptidase n=1 Tax=Actinoplanes sp. OR16 TaxID=946334 RepID=UPI000F7042FD|nr:serine protease [Actinoplanes sp. OR16]BBH69753.1 hypothetical protein ACTI_64380 [Actinoplanes sp. OR16]